VKGIPAKRAKVRRLARPEPGAAQRTSAASTRRRRRQLRIGIGVAAGLVVLVGGLVAYSLVGERPTWQSVAIMASPHILLGVPHVPYNSNPPTSGPHTGELAAWGVHSEPIPDENQVHNLEDKGVVIQYNCPAGCQELVQKLEAIIKQYTDYVVLAPRPHMDKRIALTAWGRLDTFDEFDEERIVRFIKQFRGIDHHGEG
jgi:uncharacterized protein DUF3105